MFGDRAIAHVGGGSQWRLPIAKSPIPSCAGKRGMGGQQVFHSLQIKMRDCEHFAHQFWRVRWKSVTDDVISSGEIAVVSIAAAGGWRTSECSGRHRHCAHWNADGSPLE